MKLTKIFRKLKIQFLTKLPTNNVYLTTLLHLSLITVLAAVVWFCGPILAWGNDLPLGTPEKRLYVIAFLYLCWLLKFLIVDLDVPNPFHHSDPETRKRLEILQKKFYGALQFLKKTTVSRHGTPARLNRLPWYLLIGPNQSGKTTLLAKSNVHFVLHRQLQPNEAENMAPSEHCDWWVTRDTSLIDVPGKYLALSATDKKSRAQAFIWKHFLKLIHKFRGKHGIKGIIIALPLPEMMKQGDTKKYQLHIQHLFARINELQKMFSYSMPCYLVITKCDLLSGFNEFFSESNNDEITQAWGITMPAARSNEKVQDIFIHRFNALIKKINHQLLWRLHQERNPMARPYIKDFPLQVERLKEFTLDFIKKLTAATQHLSIQGVYLTSALQPKAEEDDTIIDAPNSTQRSVQLFKEPQASSRAYFIKQFLAQGLAIPEEEYPQAPAPIIWKKRLAYAASVSVIVATALLFGKDFERGVRQAYAIQNTLSDYHLAIQKTHNPEFRLEQTLHLLNALEKTGEKSGLKLDLLHLLTFYSHKSQQKSNEVYHQALQTILLPEIRNYLSEQLKNPINRNTEYVYVSLKTYLMLGDTAHFQASAVANTLNTMLPNTLSQTDREQLMAHIDIALSNYWNPLPLNQELITQTRKYLAGLPSFQLGYIILKNMNSNTTNSNIDLALHPTATSVFAAQTITDQIPHMFTSKAFTTVINQETAMAAQEASMGNWILGDNFNTLKTPELTATLIDQLRNTYISNYINKWESSLANMQLMKPNDLAQTNALIQQLMSNDSPLLKILQILHDNTYFEPITTTSPTLQNLGLLVDKNNQSNNTLYQIFASLQAAHQYLNTILTAENEKKAAFDAIASRLQSNKTPDPLTQLRLIADKAPEPLKHWLETVANDASHYLLQDATRYMDVSWKDNVSSIYENEIGNHYPLTASANEEVPLQKFTAFFGNPGTLLNFYHQVSPFIDTTTAQWHWKSLDNHKLPCSDSALQQIQTAMKVHHLFFPNGDNKLYVPFTLQPQFLSKFVKSIKLNINDKKIADVKDGAKIPHVLTWPSKQETKMTSVELTMTNKITSQREFPGEWGWYKLVNQSLVSAVSPKAALLNLSENNYPVKYMLYTESSANPFLIFSTMPLTLPVKLSEG